MHTYSKRICICMFKTYIPIRICIYVQNIYSYTDMHISSKRILLYGCAYVFKTCIPIQTCLYVPMYQVPKYATLSSF